MIIIDRAEQRRKRVKSFDTAAAKAEATRYEIVSTLTGMPDDWASRQPHLQ